MATHAGTKRKAGDVAAVSDTANVQYCIQCSRTSHVKEFNDAFFEKFDDALLEEFDDAFEHLSCAEQHKALEHDIKAATSAADGTWIYKTRGSSGEKKGSSSSSSSMMVFSTLQAANKQAKRVWAELQKNHPFDNILPAEEQKEVWVPADAAQCRTEAADGRAKWQHEQLYRFDPMDCCSLFYPVGFEHLVCSKVTVEVVEAKLTA